MDVQRRGIGAEVIDPRSLKLLDPATSVASLRRTSRLVEADEGWKYRGLRCVGDLSNGRRRLEMLHCNLKVL